MLSEPFGWVCKDLNNKTIEFTKSKTVAIHRQNKTSWEVHPVYTKLQVEQMMRERE